MTNFENASTKIYKGQLLKRIISYQISITSVSLNANFYYVNVFFEKKMSAIKSNDSISPFLINSDLRLDNIITSNIKNHWGENYKQKILKILINYTKLFKPKLRKFKNKIKISISFKNKINVKDLKQALYFMLANNCRIMNKILNPLAEKGQVQKISLETMFSALLSVFIV